MGIGQVNNRTIGTQSVSGASGPEKAAPSVDYSESKLGQGQIQTVSDGKTKVQYNANDDVSSGARQAFFNKEGKWPPCINPSCKSYGRPHPNCLCYGSGSSEIGWSQMAQGGEVCSRNDPHHSSCEHYEHPQETLDSSIYHHGLLHLLTKTGHSKSEDPSRSMHDHKEASIKGMRAHHSHMGNLFEKVEKHKSDTKASMALKNHLDYMQQDPESLLDVGGNIGGNHGAQIASLAGTAINHLQSFKPVQSQNAPLDQKSPIDKMAENRYNRHLELAENPASILQHVKDGTLRPSDIQTISTLYPKLFTSMKSKANDSLMEAITNGKIIPYKQKLSLSLLLGQPLDSTQTPQSMQAIMASVGPQQVQNQAQKQPKKASGVELKQINKVDEMSETSLQRRQIARK